MRQLKKSYQRSYLFIIQLHRRYKHSDFTFYRKNNTEFCLHKISKNTEYSHKTFMIYPRHNVKIK